MFAGKRWRSIAGGAGLTLALLGCSGGPPHAEPMAPGPLLDAHSHYTAADAAVFSPAAVIARLDAAGVRRIVLAGVVLMIHGDAEIVERVFELAPRARVLWAHLGTFPVPDLLDAMLERHGERLWIDTSVRDERIAPEGVLLPEWRALFARHPRRFVVAVDTFSVNRWHAYEEVVARIRAWTADLPEPLRGDLLHDNAARLFADFPARRASD